MPKQGKTALRWYDELFKFNPFRTSTCSDRAEWRSQGKAFVLQWTDDNDAAKKQQRLFFSGNRYYITAVVLRPDQTLAFGNRTSMSAREVQGLIPGPVKSDTGWPAARHDCDISSALCCPGAKPRRWDPPLVKRFVVISRV